MTIRRFAHEDVDAIVEMSARMHAESAYSFLPFDRGKVEDLIKTYIDNPGTYYGLVAEDGDRLAGMLGGFLTQYFFCDETLACDDLVFVEPEYRGGTTAARLIKAFREWAAGRGAREVTLGVSTNVNVDATGRFYEGLGFTRVGAVYKLRVG